MPFDNSKDRDNSKCMFELTLSLIVTLIRKFEHKNIPILLMGDFNSDINRQNRFDIILKNFIRDHNLILIDNINNNEISHTFSSALINNKIHHSNIDHFILHSNSSIETLKNLNFHIFDDVANTSDHRAININFLLNHKKTNLISHDDTTENKTLNLNSPEVLEFYQNKIQEHSEKAFDKSLNLSYDKDEQNYINELYLSLCNIFTKSS